MRGQPPAVHIKQEPSEASDRSLFLPRSAAQSSLQGAQADMQTGQQSTGDARLQQQPLGNLNSGHALLLPVMEDKRPVPVKRTAAQAALQAPENRVSARKETWNSSPHRSSSRSPAYSDKQRRDSNLHPTSTASHSTASQPQPLHATPPADASVVYTDRADTAAAAPAAGAAHTHTTMHTPFVNQWLPGSAPRRSNTLAQQVNLGGICCCL